MSAAAKADPSARRVRAVLMMVLVVVVALVVAAATVLISQRTYAPSERTLSPSIQVAAGSDHVDHEAGLTVPVPEGWKVMDEGDLVFGTTALVPEDTPGPGEATYRSGGMSLVLIGKLTPELFASAEPDNTRAAIGLTGGMGEFFVPIPGQRTDPRLQELSTRVGDGTGASYRVVPEIADALPGGALVYSSVVGEGDQRYWVTYIGNPADGSMSSPGVEWADALTEGLEPIRN